MTPSGDEQLRDRHGRPIGDMRVSVTDLCNLRCFYCMPEDGVAWQPRSEILTFEEIVRLVEVFARMGVAKVRLTGGEPLVRKDFPMLAREIASVEQLRDLSLTTNGLLLARDAAALVDAGVKRFNVSLDALTRERYQQVTRRDGLKRVLEGLHALRDLPGERTIKVNAVAIRGVSEYEALGLAELARTEPFTVRFIEQMPLGADRSWQAAEFLPGDELREIIHAVYPLEPLGRAHHATASRYRFADGAGEIGFINPVSAPFCDDCNRIRLTADGSLRTCLFSQTETDLRTPLRAGADDADLARIIRAAVWNKELKHTIGEVGFEQPDRPMSRIGG